MSSSQKRLQVSNDPETLDAQQTPKRAKTWIEILKCPICMELPRSVPIYKCPKEHQLCLNCSSKVDTCPVCLQETPIKCKFDACNVKSLMAQLGDHEQVCKHRPVTCPLSLWNACAWRGSFIELIKHIKEKMCVSSILWWKGQSRFINEGIASIEDNLAMDVKSPVFKLCLSDFPANSPSVFDRPNVITHWQPNMLLSKELELELSYHGLYVVVQRDSRGIWTLMVRSMLPAKMCERVRVKVKVMDWRGDLPKTSFINVNGLKVKVILGQDDKTSAMYVYHGKVVCQEMSMEEAIKTGRCLCLTDDQIKQFKGRGKNLFHYSVEVSLNPDLER